MRGREPLIQFSITGEAAAQNISLQFRELQLLVGDRVTGVERGPGEQHLLVLPHQVTGVRRPLVAN